MSRNQWTLAGVLALQVLLILVFRTSLVGATDASEPRALLPALQAGAAAKIELTSADEQPITLQRDGASWGVAQLDGFPADGDKVERLIDDLKAVTVRRPIVTSTRYHETFKVADDDNEARIKVWTDADEPAADLIVGDAPNYRVTHVRRADESAVFEARGLSSYDLRSATGNWIRKELVDAKQDQVVGIVVDNPAGRFELEKSGDAWKVVAPENSAGLELDANKVDELVRAATSLRLADAVGKRDDAAQGLASPEATIVLRWSASDAAPAEGETPADLREETIQVGAKLPDEDAQRYIGRSGFAWAGTIWDSSVKTLLEKKLSDVSAG